jgi:predicted lipid carrier protein YhbT
MLSKLSSLPLPLPAALLPALPTPKSLLAKLPLLAAKKSSIIPFALRRSVMTRLMAQAFKEPLEDGDFEFLEGRWLKVEISDAKLAWFFSYSDTGKLIIAQQAEADACIRGNLKEFMLLASREEDPDTLFFQRRLMIEGDTEIGLAVKNLMDSVDHDSMPPMIRLILTKGSVLANKLL